MSDIAHCYGTEAPICKVCWRRAEAHSERQVYFSTPPLKDGECVYYVPVSVEEE